MGMTLAQREAAASDRHAAGRYEGGKGQLRARYKASRDAAAHHKRMADYHRNNGNAHGERDHIKRARHAEKEAKSHAAQMRREQGPHQRRGGLGAPKHAPTGMVKAHTRKTKSGKTVQVRAHKIGQRGAGKRGGRRRR